MNLKFGREISNNLQSSTSREWLVTNGIGGYAAGTISGVLTRSYHGLLIAALKPPVNRTLLLTKLEETVIYSGQSYELSSNRWADGASAPQGYKYIESFHLDGTTPVWKLAIGDGFIEKRVWMQQGENTTYIRYSYLSGSEKLGLSLKALVNHRNHHGGTNMVDNAQAEIIDSSNGGLKITLDSNAASLYLSGISDSIDHDISWERNNTWYQNFALEIEQYRGLGHIDHHFHAATANVCLEPGNEITIVASSEEASIDQKALINNSPEKRESELIKLFYARSNAKSAPKWIEQLVLAADQFIVNRPLTDNPEGKTIIAGYPWFTDWGRDTMISLSGLTISTGRYDVAKTILQTFAQYVDEGMLPNVFPDRDSTPEYNTVDATLWYFDAIYNYYVATKDREFIDELFPLLAEIIDWHIKGTRYNIHMDEDGLLYAGDWGVQLTWMDAKVGDWVVTPRIGKPVEVNALWYNALVCMVHFSQVLGKPEVEYQKLASQTRSHFSKFWFEEGGYCYDVIDSPNGNDASFRPNQIFAVSLPGQEAWQNSPLETLLSTPQQKMVVNKVGQNLITSYGLRSLDSEHPSYVGIYGGNPLQRDGSYHQGTTWGWLIGHYAQAHWQVYKDPQAALSFIEPLSEHLADGCIGSISEIFDGDSPFTPRGCFAQAWSVAEVLRVWLLMA